MKRNRTTSHHLQHQRIDELSPGTILGMLVPVLVLALDQSHPYIWTACIFATGAQVLLWLALAALDPLVEKAYRKAVIEELTSQEVA